MKSLLIYLLIGSLVASARPCESYLSRKKTEFRKSYFNSLESFRIWKSEVLQKDVLENLTLALTDGLEQGFISERNLKSWKNRIQESKDYNREGSLELVKKVEEQVLKAENIKNGINRKSKYIAKKFKNDFLVKESLKRESYLGKVSLMEANLIRQKGDLLSSRIKSEKDAKDFFDLVYLIHHEKDVDRLKLLNNLEDIYKVKKGDFKKKSLKSSEVLKKLELIDKKSKGLRSKRLDVHGDIQKAIKEESIYRNQKLSCKARNLRPDRLRNALDEWKWLIYGVSLATVTGTFGVMEIFDKEKEERWEKESFKVLSWELFMTALSTYIGTNVITAEGLKNFTKVLVKYSAGMLSNVIDMAGYKYFFMEQIKTKDDLNKIAEAIVKALLKNEDVRKLVERIDKSEDASLEIKNILVENNYTEINNYSEDFIDSFQKILSVKAAYEEEHHDNLIGFKSGDKSVDRLRYNSAYGVWSSIKSLVLGVFSYNLFCQGRIVGNMYIGGAQQKTLAKIITLIILALDKTGSTYLYFKGREKVINQGF